MSDDNSHHKIRTIKQCEKYSETLRVMPILLYIIIAGDRKSDVVLKSLIHVFQRLTGDGL